MLNPHARTEIEPNIRTVRFVPIEDARANGNVFRNEDVFVAPQIRQCLPDFFVGKMLKNLTDETEVGWRQVIARDICALESSARIENGVLVVLNQFGNDIDAHVIDSARLDDVTPYRIIAAAQIDDPVHVMFANEFKDKFAIAQRSGSARTGSRRERLTVVAPGFCAVDMLKRLSDRELSV
jgi:hypothetical protein